MRASQNMVPQVLFRRAMVKRMLSPGLSLIPFQVTLKAQSLKTSVQLGIWVRTETLGG